MSLESHRTLFQAKSAELCRRFNKIICLIMSLISTASSANIPVSLRFFREFEIARLFEKPLSPSCTHLTENPLIKRDFARVVPKSSYLEGQPNSPRVVI